MKLKIEIYDDYEDGGAFSFPTLTPAFTIFPIFNTQIHIFHLLPVLMNFLIFRFFASLSSVQKWGSFLHYTILPPFFPHFPSPVRQVYLVDYAENVAQH